MSDYPDHLNPFDENYIGAPPGRPIPDPRQKYNTWSAPSKHKVSTNLDKVSPAFIKKHWAALNISPGGKLVRRLSIVKSAVEKFASKAKRLSHSSSFTERESELPPRSHSVHDDFAFRIVSPKLKEKIRQQAFSKALEQTSNKDDECQPSVGTPQLNGHSTPSSPETDGTTISELSSSVSPESEKEFCLGARPKFKKKRPPPPPPALKPAYIVPVLQIVETEYCTNTDSTSNVESQPNREDQQAEPDPNNLSFVIKTDSTTKI